MLNLRPIDKFILSGGWEYIYYDVQRLKNLGVVAVLDLQFTPEDQGLAYAATTEACQDAGIAYKVVRMRDDEFNRDIENLFARTYNILDIWADEFPGEDQKILVKCGVGTSRSPAVLINYYCVANRWTFTEAKQYIEDAEADWSQLGLALDPFFTYTLKNMYPDPSYWEE